MRILIVEDEEKIAKALKIGLEKNGYAVDYVTDGDSAERRIDLDHREYDLIILDLMIPGKDGVTLCRDIRKKGLTIPVIILTARDMTDDKILALDAGGDDYLTKPFSFEELLARIRALLRRPPHMLGSELTAGDIALNPATREVRRGGEKVTLTLKEFSLLHYLMRYPGEVLSRENIYTHLWDFADTSFSNTIDVHIKNLRKKLSDTGHEKVLETLRGVGYRIKK